MIRRVPRRGLLLLLVCALAGGVIAASQAEPVYRSEGVLGVADAPAGSDLPAEQALCPWRRGPTSLAAEALGSDRLAAMALRTAAWQETGDVEHFASRREVVAEPEAATVRVSFEDSRPEVAQAGVRALLDAYRGLHAERLSLAWAGATPSADAERAAARRQASETVRIVEPATLPGRPIRHPRATYAAWGAGAGLLLGLLALLLLARR